MNKLKLEKKRAGSWSYKYNSKSEGDCITFIKKRFDANLFETKPELYIPWGEGVWLDFQNELYIMLIIIL